MSETDDETPTALAVARAVVASARVLQEDPLEIDGGVAVRCRFTALHALRIIYPGMTWVALGRMVGLSASPRERLGQAMKSSWWPNLGALAIEAALDALETV